MTKQKKSILAFDIDGTLLNSQHFINPKTLDAIRQAKQQNYLIVFCSGRPYVDMVNLQDETKIADYIICNNGTYFFDVKQNQFYFKNYINSQLAKRIIAEGKKYCGLLALHTAKVTYRTKLCSVQTMPSWYHDALEEEKIMFFDKYNYPLTKILHHLDKKLPIMQIAFRLDDINAAQLQAVLEQKFAQDVAIAVANEVYVDINPFGTNKFTGIQNLCQHIKRHPDEVIAFGDSDNDLQMLQNVGWGICMGNGTPKAKSVAKEVIGTNDSDAIFHKLHQILRDNHT